MYDDTCRVALHRHCSVVALLVAAPAASAAKIHSLSDLCTENTFHQRKKKTVTQSYISDPSLSLLANLKVHNMIRK